MNIEIKIGTTLTLVNAAVFSHILTCHRLNLYEWEKREKKKFTDNVAHGLDRQTAEKHLGWLYVELEKIEGQYNLNKEMNEALSQALTSVH